MPPLPVTRSTRGARVPRRVTDVGAAGFEDPQAEEPEHRNEGEVVRVWGEPAGGEHGLELQVGQPQSG